MSKTLLRCVGFKPRCRGSLRGFASVEFSDLRMVVVHGIGVHVRGNGAAWASPPLLEFASAKIRRARSDRVLLEVLKFDPDALQCREEHAA